MGEYSTIRVTRTAARSYLVARFMGLDDAEIERLMDGFLCERLYTVRIVGDHEENEDEIL